MEGLGKAKPPVLPPSPPTLPETLARYINATPWDQLVSSTEIVDPAHLFAVREALWVKYRDTFTCQAERELSVEKKIGEKMKIGYTVIGKRPPEGYPLYICLHGGGGCPPLVNDTQWEHMQVYYRDSVSTGVYVAPRGITNTWNLHFVKESYELYDRLIAYMILCHGVDPNRVYLLGFSAGGDGVYQVTPRMADRWAAANMSSGHPNGVSMVNLYHVPFAIQVGELDTAYKRCRAGAEYGLKLDDLMRKYPDGYTHECWVHSRKGHSNIRDNDKKRCSQAVMCDFKTWLESGECSKCNKTDTNAIAWVSQHQRNPIPPHVIWDVSTRAHRNPLYPIEGLTAPSDLFYWIGIRKYKDGECKATHIEASFDCDSNTIHINEDGCGPFVRVLITKRMLDTSAPVKINVGEREFSVTLVSCLGTMVRTLLERGDPNYVFESEVILSKTASHWEISGSVAV